MGEQIIIDPVEAQLQGIANLPMSDLDLTEPVNPQVVNLLIQQNRYNLMELKSTKHENSELRKNTEILNKSIQELRVELAGSKINIAVSYAEICISLLGGFAITKLTTDIKDPVGWVVGIICGAILIFFKSPYMEKLKENKHDPLIR